MKRRQLIQGALGLCCAPLSGSLFAQLTEALPKTDTQPVAFIGHGSPMNAIEDNLYSQAWKSMAGDLPRPAAILCISAHWLSRGSFVGAVQAPETIHDFGGFPQELFDVQYPAPGSPEGAELLQTLTRQKSGKDVVRLDHERGLDHGTWSVLRQMYPDADIPVFQLSIDYHRPMAYHYALAQQLAALRERGVLIIGSGNIVHNLRAVQAVNGGYDWAVAFDEQIKRKLIDGDHQSILNYQWYGKAAELSVPTPDHYIPMLYSIGLQRSSDELSFYNESLTRGAISMRSFVLSPS
ncbi:4,5-DOPA-extradiol-dioxygenase [Marinobacterium lutimaris]|uniref:4,5-DOPA dioxygenase extradiol n=1 Tax=Marinobacterium lutimaris TaxID=568106 RepID=A0A1H6DD14_9GAMM|nr:4,5-DOPA dioxygenase extradiol [Marinobacterium lutimaris]SEG82683.1 4,5-DOPA dioxygenase extradiol [Marinobacterium lutimaris]